MTNLKEETLEAIANSGHTLQDVRFIGSADGKFGISVERFLDLADQEYDSGFGSAEVATDLIVIFKDGKKMWRDEYDGSESWNYDSPAKVDYDDAINNINELIGRYWPTVSDLHDPNPHNDYMRKSPFEEEA